MHSDGGQVLVGTTAMKLPFLSLSSPEYLLKYLLRFLSVILFFNYIASLLSFLTNFNNRRKRRKYISSTFYPKIELKGVNCLPQNKSGLCYG